MAEARQRAEWRQVCALLAGIANGPLRPKAGRRGWTADDFDPFTSKQTKPQSVPLNRAGLRSFRALLFGFH